MRRAQYVLTFLVLLAGSALAQSPGGPPANPEKGPGMHRLPPLAPMGDWWKDSEIAQKINLSEGQKQQLQQIFSDHRSNLTVLRGNFETEEGKLRTLISQDQPPADDQVLAQVDQVSVARGRMDREFASIALAFRKVLSGDQWKLLQNITMERFKAFRMHHRGDRTPGTPPPDSK